MRIDNVYFNPEQVKLIRSKINKYCKIKDPTTFELFKLFSELTGFDIKKWRDGLISRLNKKETASFLEKMRTKE